MRGEGGVWKRVFGEILVGEGGGRGEEEESKKSMWRAKEEGFISQPNNDKA